MSLLFFDGFETYNSNTDAVRVPELVGSSIQSIGATSGRRSSRCACLGSTFAYIVINPQNTISDNTTIILAIAMYVDHTGYWYYNSANPWISIEDGSGNRHIGVFGKQYERVLEIRNGGGTILGTGTFEFEYQTWTHVQIKIYFHDTAGTVQVKINEEITDIDLSSQDTINGSNGYCGKIVIKTPEQYNAMRYDDLYLLNGQGSIRNDFLGDLRVDVVRVNGAGSHTDFTPSAGSNYQNVDDTTPDDDTTYNYASTVSDQDSYALESLEVLGSQIYGVKNQITVRRDDVGTKKAKIISRLNSTDYLGDEETMFDSYKTFIKVYEQNPDDSADFEEADITAMESGIEITA